MVWNVWGRWDGGGRGYYTLNIVFVNVCVCVCVLYNFFNIPDVNGAAGPESGRENSVVIHEG